jgi:hypothetical protein
MGHVALSIHETETQIMAYAEVTIKDTCRYGGKAGKVLHFQEFPNSPGVTWYWTLIPELNPNVPLWFGASCLDVKTGRLPTMDALKGVTTYRHKIEKGGNVAFFKIDKPTKDVLIREGYAVTYAP